MTTTWFNWYEITFDVDTREYDKEVERSKKLDDGLFDQNSFTAKSMLKYVMNLPHDRRLLDESKRRNFNIVDNNYKYTENSLGALGIFPISDIYSSYGKKVREFLIPILQTNRNILNYGHDGVIDLTQNIELRTNRIAIDELFGNIPYYSEASDNESSQYSPRFTPLPPSSVGFGLKNQNHSTESNGSSSGLVLSPTSSTIGSASTIPASVEDSQSTIPPSI